MMGKCSIQATTLERGVPALILQNDLIAATILPGKGADIASLVSKPDSIDVLWKSPWGLPPPGGVHSAANSQAAWLEAYEGGWQELFPNGGTANTYRGVELNFHGEASLAAWDYEIVDAGGDVAALRLSTRLRRSPFLIERVMRVEAGKPVLFFRERITNQSREDLEAMWGHHPAYGAPFLSGACRVDTNARTVHADDVITSALNPLTPGGTYSWPHGERDGVPTDLSIVAGPDDPPQETMSYLTDFDGDHGWYGITNTEIGLGVGLVWPTAIFPYAWYWQEMHAGAGFPWYGEVYVMAIEPFSSWPGHGLSRVIETTGTQLSIPAGENIGAELAAVLYHAKDGISGIAPDGSVALTPAIGPSPIENPHPVPLPCAGDGIPTSR
jgi:hypothetical protein